MFEDWLVMPNNLVSWIIRIFSNFGPIPLLLIAVVTLVVFRPRIPQGIPLHHKRAISQSHWTLQLAVALSAVSLILYPSLLSALANEKLLSEVAYTGLYTTIGLLMGVFFLVPYLIGVHIWFPIPMGWIPNKSWQIAPRPRMRIWLLLIVCWLLVMGVLLVNVLLLPESASISDEQILTTLMYYIVEGMIFILLSIHIQVRTAWRSPIPGVPLTVDVARRRHDIGTVQRTSIAILGAAIAQSVQYAAQIQYEIAPFWASAFSFTLAWAISLGSLATSLVPGWWWMRQRDPSRKLTHDLERRILSTGRDRDIFSPQKFRETLELDEEMKVTGSRPQPMEGYWKRLFHTAPREELTAPGTGSAPEEIAEAYTYMAKIAARAGVPLSMEEMAGLSEIRELSWKLIEKRVAINEGVASNLISEEELNPEWQDGSKVGLPGVDEPNPLGEEAVAPLDPKLAQLLGQQETAVPVGLDSQTIDAWKHYDAEQEAAKHYQEEMEHQRALEQTMWENYADPYSYTAMDPYGYTAMDPYGYGIPTDMYGYEGYGYPAGDTYGYPGMDPYGYTAMNPYSYRDGYAMPTADYSNGADPYGYGMYGGGAFGYPPEGQAAWGGYPQYGEYPYESYDPNTGQPYYPPQMNDSPVGYLEPGPSAAANPNTANNIVYPPVNEGLPNQKQSFAAQVRPQEMMGAAEPLGAANSSRNSVDSAAWGLSPDALAHMGIPGAGGGSTPGTMQNYPPSVNNTYQASGGQPVNPAGQFGAANAAPGYPVSPVSNLATPKPHPKETGNPLRG